jgi:hypothetical protein
MPEINSRDVIPLTLFSFSVPPRVNNGSPPPKPQVTMYGRKVFRDFTPLFADIQSCYIIDHVVGPDNVPDLYLLFPYLPKAQWFNLWKCPMSISRDHSLLISRTMLTSLTPVCTAIA